MPRPEKVQAVADIKERITNAQAVFLAEYAGLSVGQQQTLRRELKANGAEFKVVKMTLTRLAAAELEIDTLDEHLLGPTGLAIADAEAEPWFTRTTIGAPSITSSGVALKRNRESSIRPSV